jgi:hypothetical protein
MQRQQDIRVMQQINTSLPPTCLKYFEKDIEQFSEALAQEQTTVCEPINKAKIATMRGLVKDEELRESFLTKFDLGFVPKKLHMICLFFLRMNQNITALHCKQVDLKADVIRYLLKDFVNLKEFTLQFAEQQSSVVGGGYGDVLN